jgi:hypothetical protein
LLLGVAAWIIIGLPITIILYLLIFRILKLFKQRG